MSSFLRVSARCHDGLVIMESLSRAWNKGGLLSLEEISKETLSPLGYLEQIAAPLRSAGLICGERGAGGGYRLGRDPRNITVKEVIEALEGPIALVDCLGNKDGCSRTSACRTRSIWSKLQKRIEGAVQDISIFDIL